MAYEKMPCLYETVDDLRSRLEGTICRYKGRAGVVAIETKKKISLMTHDLAGLIATFDPADPEFDISSPEIGYVNVSPSRQHLSRNSSLKAETNLCFYVERTAQRQFRQGLYNSCLTCYSIDGISAGMGHVWQTRGLMESIEGTFPSLELSLDLLKTGQKEVAISRRVAFKRTDSGLILVYYAGKNVGWLEPKSTRVSIPEGPLSWLKEILIRKEGLEPTYA